MAGSLSCFCLNKTMTIFVSLQKWEKMNSEVKVRIFKFYSENIPTVKKICLKMVLSRLNVQDISLEILWENVQSFSFIDYDKTVTDLISYLYFKAIVICACDELIIIQNPFMTCLLSSISDMLWTK